MDSFASFIESYNSRFSALFPEKKAEMVLISRLLTDSSFSSPGLQYQLSRYPVVDINEKSKTVCDLMASLWPSDVGQKQFGIFKKFEDFLIAIGKRDHFFHQFLVYLIGLNIIQMLSDGKSKKELEVIFGFKVKGDIYSTWLFASTFHDFGYPYEVAYGLSKEISGLYEEMGLSDVASHYDLNKINKDKTIPYNLKRLTLNSSNEESKVLEISHLMHNLFRESLDISEAESKKLNSELIDHRDHGYVSALLLCKNYIENNLKAHNKWGNFKRTNNYKSVRYAMTAVALHNIRNKSWAEKIDADRNIYSYLLYIIDNLQDWSRSFRENPKYPHYHLIRFERDDSSASLRLDYKLTSHYWSSDMKTDVYKSIGNRKKYIAWLDKKNKVKKGISIQINYFISNHEQPEGFKVEL